MYCIPCFPGFPAPILVMEQQPPKIPAFFDHIVCNQEPYIVDYTPLTSFVKFDNKSFLTPWHPWIMQGREEITEADFQGLLKRECENEGGCDKEYEENAYYELHKEYFKEFFAMIERGCGPDLYRQSCS